MDIASLIIALVSGLIGGNVAGAALPDKSLGTLGNSITGLLGGGVGEFVLKLLGVAATTATTAASGDATSSAAHLDIASILSSIIAGGAGGGALTAIIGAVKDALAKK